MTFDRKVPACGGETSPANKGVLLSRPQLEQFLYVPDDDFGSKSEAAAIAVEVLLTELLRAGLPYEVASHVVLRRAIEQLKLAL